jgi:hypothetical protein
MVIMVVIVISLWMAVLVFEEILNPTELLNLIGLL